MTTTGNEVHLSLEIKNAQGEFDADELNQLAQTLMRSLEDVGAESATLIREQDSPQGAKGDPITIGVLLVAVLPNVLPKVMEFLQSWVVRINDHTIKAKIQRGDRSVEIEYSANIPLEKIQKHMDLIKQIMNDSDK